jgi:hypothetical protein
MVRRSLAKAHARVCETRAAERVAFSGCRVHDGTGQNRSARGFDGFRLPVSRRVAEEFGLPGSFNDSRAFARSAYGLARSVKRRIRRRELARRRSARPPA